MPFDPTRPINNAQVTATELRGQFTGLQAIIDALAAGTITGAVVDAVDTIPAGTPAGVGVNVTGNTMHLTFSIPQGNDGAPGPQGNNGTNGNDGQTGPAGSQGEVSAAQLNTAITDALAAAAGNSSAKSNGVAMLDAPFADPDMETLRTRMNDLISALRR